ncbi:phosphoadenosine phosphosulfate reductase [Corynebacterium pyruviciproducens ATCC BAA-1742]|uniref:Adenosine 5'-phosphosulfate reductase n=1 Tax=Corynebacterium pyruviciproducens ATCC BAA-1742 TaxID=1125779 RepID=S2YVI9_9CORY|nr:phosphoadenosine phosphosulfate reductase [Corynebacterium pyruviciproducens ATCC BAA-1742]
MTSNTNRPLTGGQLAGLPRPTIEQTGQLPEDIRAENARLVEEYADALYDATAEEILSWAHEYAPGRLVLTLSMENTVLSELASRYLPDADGLFLDTGYHFPETLAVPSAVEKHYPRQRLVRAHPRQTVEEQDETWGTGLFSFNPSACCDLRKVEPLSRALTPYAGWVTGLRRADGPTRATAPALSLDKTGRLKISPLITWTLEDTERYIKEHDLIENPLTRQGYPSIGCAPCTRRVRPGRIPGPGVGQDLPRQNAGFTSDYFTTPERPRKRIDLHPARGSRPNG